MNPVVRPPEEEWDPEYTPKSRKYYLVSLLWLSGCHLVIVEGFVRMVCVGSSSFVLFHYVSFFVH